MRRTSANLLLLLAGAIWGMGFIAQSSAMDSIGPLTFLGLRFLIASIALLPFARREQRRARTPLDGRTLAGFLACGTALFAAMTFQQYGLLTTTVTNSGFLTGLYVVFTPILTTLLMRRAPHPVVWPAAASAFFGIWLLSGGSLLSLHTGDMLTVVSALFCAVQLMLVGVSARGSSRPLALSLAQFLVCASLSFAGALVLEPIAASQILKALPEILYAGVFSSGVAFTLQVIGQRYTTAPQAAVFLSSEALFAALFGALFLGERISGQRYLGCLFIFAAILAVELLPMLLTRRRKVSVLPEPVAEPVKALHSHLR